MKLTSMSNEAVLRKLGARVRRERLNQNTTQHALATQAGLSRRVVVDIEGGKGCSLSSFIEILRALRKLDQMDSFLPDPGLSPIQLAELQGRARQRATGGRSSSGGR